MQFHQTVRLEPSYKSRSDRLCVESVSFSLSVSLSISLITLRNAPFYRLSFNATKWNITHTGGNTRVSIQFIRTRKKTMFKLFLVNTMKHKCLLIRASFHSFFFHGSKIKFVINYYFTWAFDCCCHQNALFLCLHDKFESHYSFE